VRPSATNALVVRSGRRQTQPKAAGAERRSGSQPRRQRPLLNVGGAGLPPTRRTADRAAVPQRTLRAHRGGRQPVHARSRENTSVDLPVPRRPGFTVEDDTPRGRSRSQRARAVCRYQDARSACQLRMGAGDHLNARSACGEGLGSRARTVRAALREMHAPSLRRLRRAGRQAGRQTRASGQAQVREADPDARANSCCRVAIGSDIASGERRRPPSARSDSWPRSSKQAPPGRRRPASRAAAPAPDSTHPGTRRADRTRETPPSRRSTRATTRQARAPV